MKHLFIVNPAAGKGRTIKHIPEIYDYFKDSGDEFIIEITKYPGHATEIAAKYSAKDDCRIYSVGGDGTLNEVLNGMAGSGSSLAVIPCGSGNDFIKSIEGTPASNVDISNIIKGAARLIDMGRVNGRYFVNIASLGFDGQVVHTTQLFKKIPFISGKAAYILGVLATIIMCKKNLLEIKIDKTYLKTKTLLIAIGNGKYYGGGMLALPDAITDDGLLDICLAESMSRFRMLRLFPRYMKGLHKNIRGVHFFKGKKIEIKSERPIILNTDGEITTVNSADFEIIPRGLNFVFPKLD